MPRPLRPLVADGIYHVYSRSRPDLDLLSTDAERRMFLTIAVRVIRKHGWTCFAYCLMPNHFHLVARTPEADLDLGMHALLSEFVRRRGRIRGEAGPVMRGRYGSRLLETEAHLLEVLRYVPLNPCRGGLVGHPSEWPWSSHRALAGETAALDVLAVDEVHALLESVSGRGGPEGYRDLLKNTQGAPDVRPFPPSVGPGLDPELATLLGEGAPAEIGTAFYEHGYSMRAIAGGLGCTTATVSRRLRQVTPPRSR